MVVTRTPSRDAGFSTMFSVLLACGRRYEPLTDDPYAVVGRMMIGCVAEPALVSNMWQSMTTTERHEVQRRVNEWRRMSPEALSEVGLRAAHTA